MIVFGSRGSRLALRQTEQVAEAVKAETGEDFRIEVIETSGDRVQDRPLAQIGIKGLFTQELTDALRDGSIDAAVHSLKDLPVDDPAGLVLAAIPERVDPRDILVYDPEFGDPEAGTLPLLGHTRVGTSSPRRASSLLSVRPDLEPADIRGNVPTRVQKVRDGRYHGIVLAAAGLARLELDTEGLCQVPLPVALFTPAPGQGALAVQCRAADPRVRQLLACLHHEETARCVDAERKVLALLGGGCSMPLGTLVERVSSGYRMWVSLFAEQQPGVGVRLDLDGDDPDLLADEAARELAPLLHAPLAGIRVVLLRPDSAGGRIGAGLVVAGAEVETVAVTEVLPLAADLDGVPAKVVAFSSARAVDRFFELAAVRSVDLTNTCFLAGGPATREAVTKRGHRCLAPTDSAGGGDALAELVLESAPAQETVLFPCAEERHGAFEEKLAAQGRKVLPLPVYRKVEVWGVEIPAADYCVVTSPSAVFAIPAVRDQRCLALGQTTADAMEAAGITPDGVASAPTPTALAALIAAARDNAAREGKPC